MEKGNQPASSILRQKAEELLKQKRAKSALQLSETEALRFIQELEVHQIELEMQNEELILAKSALKIAAEKYTELYDFAPSGYFTLSKEGKIIELNLFGSQMLGKERSHLINSSFGFFVSNNTKPVFNLFLGKVFKSKANETCEVTLSTNGNLPVYVLLSGIVTENSEQCLVTMIDITGRKMLEEKLKESGKRLNLFFEQSLDGFFFMMLDEPIDWNDSIDKEQVLDYVFEHLRVTKVNEAMLKQYGASEEQFLGLTLNDFFAHDLQQERQVIKDIFNNGKSHVDTWEKKFDGTDMIIEGDYICFHDSDGRITGHFGIQRDVTVARRAENDLKRSEAQLRAILDLTPFPIALVDEQDTTIDFWSRSALQLFGHTAPTTVEWYQLAYPDPIYRQEVMNRWKPFLEKVRLTNHAVNTGVYQVTCSDGSVCFCELYAAFLADILIITFNDITERKQAEENNLRQLEELKHWQEVTIGREDRNRQLKQEVNELLIRLGETIRYPSQINNTI